MPGASALDPSEFRDPAAAEEIGMDSTSRTPKVTRRQFASCAAAAAAGFLLTGCGPRRLKEVSPARLKELDRKSVV